MGTGPPARALTALIVGASRGLGLALVREYLCRGWRVIATARRDSPGALHELAARVDGRLEIETLDITRPDEILALRQRLTGRRLDLLLVNAGAAATGATIGEVSTGEFIRVMVTNALGPMRVIEALEERVPATGTIGVMSCALGSVADNEEGGFDVYRGSKAALHTLMRCFAARYRDDTRTLLIVDPGRVRTDAGRPAGVVETISRQSGTPGLRFVDARGRTVRW